MVLHLMPTSAFHPTDVNHSPSSSLLHGRRGKATSRHRRVARNSLCRYKTFLSGLSADVKAYHTDNEIARGSPRAYTIQPNEYGNDSNAELHDALIGSSIVFGGFGSEGHGVSLDGHHLKTHHVKYVAATKSYVFQGTVKPDVDSKHVEVVGYLNFESAQPTGTITVGDHTAAITLDSKTAYFGVEVSANTGAYWSTAESRLVVDEKSSAFTNATWESGSFVFGYGVTDIGDDLQPNSVAENMFIDDANTATPVEMNLLGANYGQDYTCIITPATDKGSRMITSIATTFTPPAVPDTRSTDNVKSVFPDTWDITFDPFATTFTGAYRANGVVYAVKGTALSDEEIEKIGKPQPSIVTASATPSSKHVVEAPAAPTKFTKHLRAMPTAVFDATPALRVQELLSMNPMVQDKYDPSGWSDSVAALAMDDFHKILIHYMEDDLRKAFICKTVPDLTPFARSLVDLKNQDAVDFYRSLQVPLVTSYLATTTLDHADLLNGPRADVQLKQLPTDNAIYKKHSKALYQARYKEKFGMQKFLTDQSTKPETAKIDKFAAAMKKDLAAQTASGSSGNKDYAAQLKTAQDDIDKLAQWAKDKRLHWALELLYWVTKSSMPNWYLQYKTGGVSSSLGMYIKQLNGLFGMLEDDAVNTKPGGRNFVQVFNEEVRLFQMTVIIPTLVDGEGNSKEIEGLVDLCLLSYNTSFKGSTNQDEIDTVQAAMQLYNSQIQKQFFVGLKQAAVFARGFSSWSLLLNTWQTNVANQNWFQKLTNRAILFRTMALALSAVCVVMPLFQPGGLGAMTDVQKATWGAALAGLLSTFLVSGLRMVMLWGDLGGALNRMKCFFGSEAVIDAIPQASARVQGAFSSWVTRTQRQTLAMVEADANAFSKTSRIFGRNLGETLGRVAGIALAVVAIVLTCIEISRENDSTLKAMEAMFLISNIIQVLAVAAGWILSAGAFTAGAIAASTTLSCLSLVATWGGPVAIAFLVIGLIIYLAWRANQDQRDPIQKFAEDRAKPIHLWMAGDKMAPEFFGVIPSKDNNPSLVGLGIRGPMKSALDYQISPSVPGRNPRPARRGFVDVPESDRVNLHLAGDVDKATLDTADKVDYSLDTVWSLTTDGDGNSRLFTVKVKSTTADNGDTTITSTQWFLGTSGDFTALEARQYVGTTESVKDARATFDQHTEWTVDIVTAPTTDGQDTKDDKGRILTRSNVLNAVARISQTRKVNGADVTLSLGRWITRSTTKMSGGLALCEEKNAWSGGSRDSPDTMFCDLWEISMQPLGPHDVEYTQKEWTLTTEQTDERNYPHFILPDSTSSGLDWSISPALDSQYFELVKGPSTDEGLVKQVVAKKAPVTPKTEYTVSCSLKVGGALVGTKTTRFTLEVVAA